MPKRLSCRNKRFFKLFSKLHTQNSAFHVENIRIHYSLASNKFSVITFWSVANNLWLKTLNRPAEVRAAISQKDIRSESVTRGSKHVDNSCIRHTMTTKLSEKVELRKQYFRSFSVNSDNLLPADNSTFSPAMVTYINQQWVFASGHLYCCWYNQLQMNRNSWKGIFFGPAFFAPVTPS